MNAMSAALRSAARPQSLEASSGAIARIAVLDDLAAAEPIWRRLEREGALTTPYQRYDWIAPWQRHVGTRAGIRPFLVVGTDEAGTPLFLWPLGARRTGPLVVAGFLGGKHANFNLALWRRDLAAGITAAELRSVLGRIGQAGVDLLALFNQPEGWDGLANPLALLPHQTSPSQGYRGALLPDFEALLRARTSSPTRKKMRGKERALAEQGLMSFAQVATADEAREVLDVFFRQKAERMRELGIADVFAAPGVREFITEAATAQLRDRRPAIEVYALSIGNTVVATFAGSVGGGRFCGMINSMIRNEMAQFSPGDVLLTHLVRTCCERGLTTFDLGVGEARYKGMFCNETEVLFDSFLPLTARGRVAAAAARLSFGVKGAIKRSPAMWRAVQSVRAALGARRSAE